MTKLAVQVWVISAQLDVLARFRRGLSLKLIAERTLSGRFDSFGFGNFSAAIIVQNHRFEFRLQNRSNRRASTLKIGDFELIKNI